MLRYLLLLSYLFNLSFIYAQQHTFKLENELKGTKDISEYFTDPERSGFEYLDLKLPKYEIRLFITYNKKSIKANEDKERPAVLYLGGMLGIVPAFVYKDVYTRISYHTDSIILSVDFLHSFPRDYVVGTTYLEYIYDYIQTPSFLRMLSGKIGYRVKFGSLILMSHSSGVQSIVDWYLRVYQKKVLKDYELKVSSMVLLDPVDSMGEVPNTPASHLLTHFPVFTFQQLKQLGSRSNNDFGWNFPPPVVQHNHTEVQVPLFVFATGLCSQPAVRLPLPPFKIPLPPIFEDYLWPACCPKKLGPERFRNGLKSPDQFYYNFTEYGHCDILDNLIISTNHALHLCTSKVTEKVNQILHNGTLTSDLGRKLKALWNLYDMSDYRRALTGLISVFIQRSLLGPGSDFGTEVLKHPETIIHGLSIETAI